MAALREIFVSTLLITMLLGSLTGLAVGLGLVFRTQGTIRFFATVNRWISSRAALKPLEVPRPLEQRIPEGKRRWIAGSIFTVGGAFASVLILDKVSVPAKVFVGSRASVVSLLLFDAARWFLLVACVAAVAMGIMLIFFPATWT